MGRRWRTISRLTTSVRNRREWLTALERRRVEFADRPEYLGLLEALVPQGTDPSAPQATRYRRWAARVIRGR